MKHTALHRIVTPALFAAGIFLSASSPADTITIGDKMYEDVLVSRTGSMYYVRLPREGRVISLDKSKVDPSTVTINDDPFYRDELKEQYQIARENLAAGKPPGEGQNFTVAIEGAKKVDGPSFLDAPGASGGGGGGSSLGVPRSQWQSTLGQSGIQFSGGGGTIQGQSQDGSIQVLLHGSDADLTGVELRLSVPQSQMAKIMGLMQTVNQLGSTLPNGKWIGGWLQSSTAQLLQGQSIQKTEQGVFASIVPGQQGENIMLTVTIKGA